MYEMTQVVATHPMPRIRPDGIRETWTLEFGIPVTVPSSAPEALKGWFYCPVKILGCDKEATIHPYFGRSSMTALQNAITGAGALLSYMPFAEDCIASALPNFGFAMDAVSVVKNGFKLTEKQDAVQRVARGHSLTASQKQLVNSIKKVDRTTK